MPFTYRFILVIRGAVVKHPSKQVRRRDRVVLRSKERHSGCEDEKVLSSVQFNDGHLSANAQKKLLNVEINRSYC